MTKRLLIVGAGGHGKVAADCAELTNQYSEIAFLDSGFPALNQVGVWSVIGDGEDLSIFAGPDTYFFVAIGDNHARSSIIEQLLTISENLVSLIHPSAVVSRHAAIGDGTLVCANATINIASKIGRGCIVNTAASVDHDCKLEDYVHVGPGSRLAGSIVIGKGTFVGIGCAIIPGIVIGENSIVGAGSTLLKSIPDNSVVVGSPAKAIR